MENLQLKGTQEFMGINIPVIEGGFGKGKKAMLAKTISEIHEQPLKKINQLINDNLDEFEIGIDIIDLKSGYLKSTEFLNHIMNKQSIANSSYIYLLSEQGYMALTSLMKTEKAKEIRKKLRREYFAMQDKCIERLNEQNKPVTTIPDSYNKGNNTNNNSNASTITTLEIAEMMETEHKEILKKLEGTTKPDGSIKQVGIIPVLTKRNFPLSDYFSLSSYKDASGKTNKCYKVTKLGCDFLANKFTGEKGILFTARYVKRFDEMEEEIKSHNQLSEEEKLKLQLFSKDALEVVTAHNRLVEMKVEAATIPLLENISQKEVVIEKQDQQLELQKPFVQTALKLQNTDDTVSMEQTAKLLSNNGVDIGRNTLMKVLRQHGILMENNSPYEKYRREGLFKVKMSIKENHYGVKAISVTRVTSKGLIFLDKKLREWHGLEDLDIDLEEFDRQVKELQKKREEKELEKLLDVM